MLIELSEPEVAALMDVLMNTTGSPWRMTHPLIMKIGAQQQAAQGRVDRLPTAKGNSHGGSDFDEERRPTDTFRPTGRDPSAAG